MKDINYTVSMPLECAHVTKANHSIFDNRYVEEKDAIKKDVRAPQIEFTFDLQKDIHANHKDPKFKAIIDQSYKVNFGKVELQNMFEELEKI